MWGIKPWASKKRNIVLYQLNYIPNIITIFTTINFILVILNHTKIKGVKKLETRGIEPRASKKHNIVLYQLSYIPNFYYNFHYN